MLGRKLVISLVLLAPGITILAMQRVDRLQQCPILVEEPTYIFPSLPDRVWIKGKEWKIKHTTELIRLPNDQTDYSGMTYCPDFSKSRPSYVITLYTRLVRTEVKTALLHELMHATSMCDDSFQGRHKFIESTSEELIQIFDDPRNKPVLAYLFQ